MFPSDDDLYWWWCSLRWGFHKYRPNPGGRWGRFAEGFLGPVLPITHQWSCPSGIQPLFDWTPAIVELSLPLKGNPVHVLGYLYWKALRRGRAWKVLRFSLWYSAGIVMKDIGWFLPAIQPFYKKKKLSSYVAYDFYHGYFPWITQYRIGEIHLRTQEISNPDHPLIFQWGSRSF